MRTIKFRAWYGKTMIPVGSLDFFTDGRVHVNDELVGAVLMQYTDKKIKNTEVFESDVVEGTYGEQEKEENPMKIRGIVRFESGCFVIDFQGIKTVFLREINGTDNDSVYWRTTQSITGHDWFYQIKDIKVIGNIYENSELLETPPSEERT